jgi:hypothetical protein
MTRYNIRNSKDCVHLYMQGYRWAVVVKYPYDASETKGDIVSRHRTYEAANRKCPSNGFTALYEIAEGDSF